MSIHRTIRNRSLPLDPLLKLFQTDANILGAQLWQLEIHTVKLIAIDCANNLLSKVLLTSTELSVKLIKLKPQLLAIGKELVVPVEHVNTIRSTFIVAVHAS